MSFEPRDYLRHIVVEADYLIAHSSGLTWEIFSQDETLRRAFARSLEIIGEAAKKVPDGFRARYPNIEWRSMSGMREAPGRIENDRERRSRLKLHVSQIKDSSIRRS
jgi:uncharacterized protein with HEPN domain